MKNTKKMRSFFYNVFVVWWNGFKKIKLFRRNLEIALALNLNFVIRTVCAMATLFKIQYFVLT